MYEQTLVSIARTLPLDQLLELIDFARFLQTRSQRDKEQWDELLASPQSQSMLATMAAEARKDFRAERTTETAFTEDGELAPV
jgi:hypothetical protein